MEYWLEQLMQHRCDLFAPKDATEEAAGKMVSGDGYNNTPDYENVFCRYFQTPNVSTPVEGIGRAKEFTFLTIDTLWLPEGQGVDDGWKVVNRTLKADGVTHAANYGQVHRTTGAPRSLESDGVVGGGHVEVTLFNPDEANE